jgi:4-hydroxythreonine-4-phosphate dehydrogenase
MQIDKLIVISVGELAGISPNIIILSVQQNHPNFIVFADKNALLERAKLLNLTLTITNIPTTKAGELCVLHHPSPVKTTAGKLNPENSHYVLECLTKAANYCIKHKLPLLTLPIHKSAINQAGISFSGHTEYLANLSNTKKVVMLLKCDKLSVALATTHLPLKNVSQNITKKSLQQIINIIHTSYPKHKIITLGLNPHAGEDGFLGDEEITTINPAVQAMQKNGINITQAIPADTAFSPKNMRKNTIFLAMYHDQGLSVLKTLCFHNAVNITLGLPFYRISVDHGSALHLAHTTKINMGSFKTALKEIMG